MFEFFFLYLFIYCISSWAKNNHLGSNAEFHPDMMFVFVHPFYDGFKLSWDGFWTFGVLTEFCRSK